MNLPKPDISKADEKLKLGNSCYLNGNYNQAISAYKEAWNIYIDDSFKQIDKLDFKKAMIAMNVAATLFLIENYSESIFFYKNAQKIYEKDHCRKVVELDINRAKIEMNLAVLFSLVEAPFDAIKSYQNAQKIYKQEYCKQFIELYPNRASIQMNLGKLFYSIGDFSSAKEAYQKAQDIYAQTFCQQNDELDPNRAQLAMNIGILCFSENKYSNAIDAYKNAQSIYDGDYCSQHSELDPDRAKLAMHLGISFKSSGNYADAMESYQYAQTLYYGDYCIQYDEFDPDRARLAINRGILLTSSGNILAAMEAYKNAKKIHKKKYCSQIIKLDPDRAKVAMHLGITLCKKGNYTATKKAYLKASNIYSGEYCKNNNKFDPDRAMLSINLGVLYRSEGDFPNAIKAFKNAQKIYSGDYCNNRIELDLDRTIVAMNLGAIFYFTGDFLAALNIYKYAKEVLTRNYYRKNIELDPMRANLAITIGLTQQSIGDYSAAIRSYQRAQNIFAQEYCMQKDELDIDRASLAENYGIILSLLKKYPEAIKEYKKAQVLYSQKYCNQRNDLDPYRAHLAINLGGTFNSIRNYSKAIKEFNNAYKILTNKYCEKRRELDPDRARLAINYGATLHSTEDYRKALIIYKQAEDIYNLDNSKNLSTVPINMEKSILYRNKSQLFTYMEKPLLWAIEASQKFIRLLELAPEKDSIVSIEAMWQSIRDNFATFHGNWLHFAIKRNSNEEIPKIIFAVQGREIAVEILDQFEKKSKFLHSKLKIYQNCRRQLRELSQIKNLNLVDRFTLSSSFKINQKIDTLVDQSDFQRLYQQLTQARSEAAKVSGYEFLQPNLKQFSLQNIQSNSQFKSNQALLMLISLKGNKGILLIKKHGKPIWLEVEKINKLVHNLNKYTNSIKYYGDKIHRSDYMKNRQCYRRNIETDTIKIAKKNILKPKQTYQFWPSFKNKIENNIWRPIAKYIKNLEELIILPHQLLHQLPIGIGKPEDLKLRFYPGLIFYGLKNGLIKENKTTKLKKYTEYYELGLLSYDAKDNKGQYLHKLSEEISSIENLYSNQPYKSLTCPDPFPKQRVEINLLHFAGHGGVDPRNKKSTALNIGSNKYLGQGDIIQGRSQVKHVFINACTTGQIKENSQGTPMSIVTGFMRNGTQSITAAQSPISDELASYFAPLWHKNWINNNYSKPNLTLEQTKVDFIHFVNKEYLPNQKKEVKQYLQANFDKYHVNSKEINEVLHDLAIFYYLSKKQTIHLNQICASLNEDELISKLPEKIIEFLNCLNRFKVDIAQNNIPPAIGTILFAMRSYG